MIEKIIEQLKAEKAHEERTKMIVVQYRHRLEIELGGNKCRRFNDEAENVRNAINDCFDAERVLAMKIEALRQMIVAVNEQWGPEHTFRGPVR